MKVDDWKEDDVFIVELEPGTYLADWDGDPGRTLVKESAKRFSKDVEARRGVCEARKFRPFTKARTIRVRASKNLQNMEPKQ